MSSEVDCDAGSARLEAALGSELWKGRERNVLNFRD